MVEFSVDKIENQYYSDKNIESRFVISISEDHFVQICLSSFEILTKMKPTPNKPKLMFFTPYTHWRISFFFNNSKSIRLT